MTKKLKRPVAFLSAFVMVMAMLLYFPSGTFSNIDWGLKASAAVTITESQPAKGDGSEGNPYLISSREELYWFAKLVNGLLKGVSKNTAACAKLTADITVNTGVLKSDGTLADDTSSFATWTPIGRYYGLVYYTGTFDGQGYTVSGLYYNSTTGSYDARIGLFGGNEGTIKNVGVVDSYFNAVKTIGGVCGTNEGTIENCYNTSTVSGTTEDIGGVCGYSSSGTIRNCYNTGKVSGNNEVGGVCGYNGGGTVQNCYSAGTVSASSHVGGLFGYCHPSGKLINCYYDNEKYDGTVGKYDSEDSIEQTEGVNGTRFASGEICYLLNESSSKDPAWYQNLSGTTDKYPVLASAHKTVYKSSCTGEYSNTYKGHTISSYDSNGFGSCSNCGAEVYQSAAKNSSGVYEISNAGQLYWFAGLVNGTLTDGTAKDQYANAILTNNIVVNSSVLNASGELNDGTFKVWTPIGFTSNIYFGTFDGNGKTISGLYFNDTDTEYIGLFGMNEGTIKDLGVVDSYFKGLSEVGGVCGENIGTITNCYNAGTVSGTSNYFGGVCGENDGTVQNCYNKGKISGSACTGGVCGQNYSAETNRPAATIKNCYNEGEVSGTAAYTGGVCGYNYSGTIESCYNTGTVSGSSYWTGGVCGENKYNDSVGIASTIKSCYNKGKVSGSNDYTGGVCGQNNDGTIEGCYNTGEVSGKSNVGGVCGKNKGGTIEGCYNTGTNTVSGTGDYIGGVCGQNSSGTIEGCYNVSTNTVSGTGDYTGGVCGDNKGTIEGCYNTGEVSGTRSVGGVCGVNCNKVINCYNTGEFSGSNCGGVCGNVSQGVIANCYSTGTTTSSSSGGVCAYAFLGTIANCYYDSSKYSGNTIGQNNSSSLTNACGKTTAQFNSGEVAYLLSQGCTVDDTTYSGSVWGQDLSTDSSPVLNGAKVYQTVLCTGGYSNNQNEQKAHGTSIPANNAVDPTCTEDGHESDTVCAICGETITVGATIPKLNHDFSVFVSSTDENCLNKIVTTYKCSRCDATDIIEGDFGSHTPVSADNAVEPTCTEDGRESDTVCSDCGEIIEEGATIPATGHTFNNNGDGFCEACGGYQPADLKNGVYEISNAGQLYWFADKVNNDNENYGSANAVLTANIVVNENVLNADGTLASDTSSFKTWTPIGCIDSKSYDELPYTGTFDGQGFTVSGLYFNNPEESSIGLFAYVGENGSVSNVGVVDSYFNGDLFVGGVCGANDGGTITNCYNTGTVNGSGFVGGVCGSNSIEYDEATGKYSFGQLIGCYNKGTVTGIGDYDIGGVCGCNIGIITSCYNDGTVNGTSAVGGVCGYNEGDIFNSFNNGNISGSVQAIGGVCGHNNISVEELTSHTFAGKVFNCYNTGTISGTSGSVYIGGVCGGNISILVNCYSIGTVADTGIYIGGVCGGNDSSAVMQNCYYDNEKYNGDAVGVNLGTVGDLVLGKNTDEFNSGEVAYLLSQGCTIGEGESAVTYDGDVWGQELSKTDSYPVLGGKKVLANVDESQFANDIIIYGQNASLDGTIGFNIYVSADDSYDWDKTIGGVTGVKNEGGLYVFTYNVSAKNMDESINFTVNDKIDVTVSVSDYLAALSETDNESLKNLADSMSAYGDAAKEFFSSGTVAEQTVTDDLSVYNFTVGTMPEGISYYGSSLLLESETTIRHYFKIAEGQNIANFAFTVDGESVEPVAKQGYYYIDIKNVSAKKLGTSFSVSVNDEEVITNYSVLSYVYKVLNSDSTEDDLKNLVKALYLYSNAAIAYMN